MMAQGPKHFAIKQDVIGMGLAAFKRAHTANFGHVVTSYTCDDEGVIGTGIPREDESIVNCTAQALLADAPVKDASYSFHNGKLFLIYIRFSHDQYEHAAEALRGTYGREAPATQELQNSFGAITSSHVSYWGNQGEILLLFEYRDNRDTSAIAVVDQVEESKVKKNKPTL